MELNQQYDKERMLANMSYPNLSGPYQQGSNYPQFSPYGYPQQGYPQQGYPQFDYNQGTGYGNQMAGSGMPLPSTSQVKRKVDDLLEKTGLARNHPETLTIKVPDFAHTTFKKCFNRKTPKEPVPTICTKCNNQIFTQPTSEIGVGLVACTAGTCFCCPLFFWCPFAVDECYDHSHKCSNCGTVLMKERFLLG